MTPAQTALYFRAWGAVREILRRQGVPAAECDARRHVLHQEALGYQRSSKLFTNRELDQVLAKFRSLSDPGDLNAQLEPDRQKNLRREHVAAALCAQLGVPFPAYAQGIVRQMNLAGRFAAHTLEELDARGWRALLTALTAQTKRRRPATATADPF